MSDLLLSGPKAGTAAATRVRRKIWEFDANLHCSIIGTCLTNAELRQVIVKLGQADAATATELDLHASGVALAGKRHDGAKLLNKALDRRHCAAINRFARAKSAGEVRALWHEAMQSGEIPGAYWAALTHPAANDALVREVFSEVHMLSHLVGAANRADIRRLRRLEAENADLLAKGERQKRQIVTREKTIRELSRALEATIEGNRGRAAPGDLAGDEAPWTALAADLKCRLDRSNSRAERMARQLAEARSALAAECLARRAAEARGSFAAKSRRSKAASRRPTSGPAALPPTPSARSTPPCFTLAEGRRRSAICRPWPSALAVYSCITMAASRNAAGCCRASSAAPIPSYSRSTASATRQCRW
jgi:hypothetical protein